MKYFLLTLTILFSGLQARAMVACNYSQEPCNDKGHHYTCYSFGWIGDREFCSATDVGPRTHKVTKVHTSATTILCELNPEPCDSRGNRYSCARMGTVGDYANSCSAADLTTPPPHNLGACEANCINGGGSPIACNHYCNW